MSEAEQIFEAMRRSGMNDWVGGADPAEIASLNFACLRDNLLLRPSDHVLDFGCGIGRTSVPLAEFLNAGKLVGVDIIPAQIQFCQAEIVSRFINTSFYCTDARNPHYDRLISEDNIVISEADFVEHHVASFDLIVAFSVFTHFDPAMASKYLAFLKQLTKQAGWLHLSWFFDHESNPPDRRLSDGEHFRDLGNLGFALFSPRLFEELVADAGLQIRRISYGYWRDGWRPDVTLRGAHPQDVAILYRPVELPDDFDPVRYLELNQDVAAAGVDPVRHYLDHGYREQRRLR
jgi:SAM-dependent methyltransferase